MPTKMNAKAVAGRARKVEAAERKEKASHLAAEAEEEAKWGEGAKGKTAEESRSEKAEEKARKKAEMQRLLEQDEDAATNKRSGGDKGDKGPKGGNKKSQGNGDLDDLDFQIASLSASNMDDAIEAMSLVSARSDKAGRGTQAASIEKHPERRFKPAFEAYKERSLPGLKKDHPGLRFQQYQDLLYKHFLKSPENPFNQLHVSYDASKEEKLAILKAKRDAAASRLAT
ncbi:hypothetical protein MSPP1_000020 [Malassezia sp. CBS 17886]|nr:hypothetical protein MSPP1_000020 [Malassezia sp. CBS 17886]